MILFIARHTEVDKPFGAVIRRRPGFNLSKQGIRQANQLGKFIAGQNIPIKKIFSSPLERGQETAEAIKKELHLNEVIGIRDYLNEWEEGEKTEDIVERMGKILNEAQDNYLFISHQDPIRVFINNFTNKPLLDTSLECAPGSLYQFVFDENKLLLNFKLLFVPE